MFAFQIKCMFAIGLTVLSVF